MSRQGHIASECVNKRVMVLQDNGEVVTENETEENEMPPLEDVEDEEYIPWGIDFSSEESFECASKGRRSSATGKHFPY